MRFFLCISNLRSSPGPYLRICCAALVMGPAALLAQTPAPPLAPGGESHLCHRGKGGHPHPLQLSRRVSRQASTCTKNVSKQDFDALVRAIDPTYDGSMAAKRSPPNTPGL